MKKVYIIHGYTGLPDKNWFPWLKTELEKLGIYAEVPSMPHTNNPKLDEWLKHLQEIIHTPDNESYFVGHSLGCPTILRYLESLEGNQKIGGALLVAGFAEPLPHLPQLDSFTKEVWRDDDIKNHTEKLTILNSDDDQAVPYLNAEHVRDRFHAKLVTIHGAGHINEKAGFTEVPFVLDELKEMMNL